MCWSEKLFHRSQEGYFGAYLQSNSGNKHQNNTQVSAETFHHESTYIILFLTRHNESKNDNESDDLFTHARVSLARFSSCWWRHNDQTIVMQSRE